jgi:hypothetical protein
MMKRLLPVIGGFVVVACQSDRPLATHQRRISADISDGVHAANCTTATSTCVLSNPHFFFLPPMVKLPSLSGVFNPNLAPVVQICQLGSTPDVCGTAPFSPGVVTLDVTGQMYQVNWNTDPTTIIIGAIYRVMVLAGGREIGFADVQPVSNGSQLKSIDTGEFIGLVDGRTLPIKFRIEQGALCFMRTDCVEQTFGPATTEQHVIVPSGFAAASFPRGYFTQSVTLTIFQVASGCFDGSSPPLGFAAFGCFNFSTEPKTADALGCQADPTNAAKCARVEVCPTITTSDGRYAHLELFRSDPGTRAQEVPGVAAQFIQCTRIGLGGPGLGDVASAAWRTVARAVGRLIQPPPLFAASAMSHTGLGGLSCCFSNFGWALPLTLSTVPGTDHNTAGPGVQLAPDPAVLVQYDHPSLSPAPGLAVSFAAVQGGVSAASATTGTDGVASVHWTLGSTPGVNLLVATLDSASGSPDTITATVCDPSTIMIDGILCGTEWTGASQFTFNANLPDGSTTPATLFITNDATNLYLAVRFARVALDPANSLSFEFDSDNSGTLNDGDDGIILNPDIGFKDLVRATTNTAPPGGVPCPANGLCSYFDTQYLDGRNNGAAAIHNDGTYTVYEFAHPLNSGDPHDFSRASGQTLGVTLFLRMIAAGAVFPAGFGDTTYPAEGFLSVAIK